MNNTEYVRNMRYKLNQETWISFSRCPEGVWQHWLELHERTIRGNRMWAKVYESYRQHLLKTMGENKNQWWYDKSIKIERGTRQGCPLSPLLFILSLEILNTKIREGHTRKGVKVQKEEYKLQDDVVFILEDPNKSLKILMETLKSYGEIAGLKINYQKTTILLKNAKGTEVQEREIRIKSNI